MELIEDLCSGKRQFKDFKEAHNSWVEAYEKMGWTLGPYDPYKKTHPDLVPYDDLDPREKIKDEVFVKLVQLAKETIWE